jgi:hypothetical protein
MKSYQQKTIWSHYSLRDRPSETKSQSKSKGMFFGIPKKRGVWDPFKGFSFFIEKDVPSVQFEILRSKNKFKRF